MVDSKTWTTITRLLTQTAEQLTKTKQSGNSCLNLTILVHG